MYTLLVSYDLVSVFLEGICMESICNKIFRMVIAHFAEGLLYKKKAAICRQPLDYKNFNRQITG